MLASRKFNPWSANLIPRKTSHCKRIYLLTQRWGSMLGSRAHWQGFVAQPAEPNCMSIPMPCWRIVLRLASLANTVSKTSSPFGNITGVSRHHLDIRYPLSEKPTISESAIAGVSQNRNWTHRSHMLISVSYSTASKDDHLDHRQLYAIGMLPPPPFHSIDSEPT